MSALSGESKTPMGPHERYAACIATANAAIEEADKCRANDSSVGVREWMQAAGEALAAARIARDLLPREPSP